MFSKLCMEFFGRALDFGGVFQETPVFGKSVLLFDLSHDSGLVDVIGHCTIKLVFQGCSFFADFFCRIYVLYSLFS